MTQIFSPGRRSSGASATRGFYKASRPPQKLRRISIERVWIVAGPSPGVEVDPSLFVKTKLQILCGDNRWMYAFGFGLAFVERYILLDLACGRHLTFSRWLTELTNKDRRCTMG